MIIPPIPRSVSRPLSVTVLVAWVCQMGALVNRAYLQAAPVALGGDLSRYGPSAHWKGIYYRGDKIGFVVGQTTPRDDGYELQEDGQIQMTLMGATTAARLSTSALVDRAFGLRSFSFSLDPGTGSIAVTGHLEALRLHLRIQTPTGTRDETRDLMEAPLLGLNLPRHLAAQGLAPGKRFQVRIFDPATLANAPMFIEVKERELVRAAGRPLPAFRVEGRFSGISSTSWITETGEVLREESPTGLVILKETQEQATALAVSAQVRADLLQAAAIEPRMDRPIDDPSAVEYLRVRLTGAGLSGPDLQGVGQSVDGEIFEVRYTDHLPPGPHDPDLQEYLAAEPFIESDAPEIVAEARRATAGITGSRAQAERLVRHVNALLEKKPTLSLPSAREVLRTKVGDCNEHTILYVALARALGLPARVAVGLVHLRGAFFYHAWSEVYLDEAGGRGRWLAVDPTLNQFAADATHLRLARGGLDRQAAILPLIGRARIAVIEFRMRPGATPILVGREGLDSRPLDIVIPRRGGSARGCWSRPGT